jgi:hypothetical protein
MGGITKAWVVLHMLIIIAINSTNYILSAGSYQHNG